MNACIKTTRVGLPFRPPTTKEQVMAKILNQWTIFEKTWLITAVITITTLCIIWQDNWLGFISSISGILCVILAAKGKLSTYYFGTIQAATYAYIAYGYGLYGEAMLNAFFYLPLQFIGWFLWFKNRKPKNQTTHGEDIYAKKLTLKQWAWLIPLLLATIAIYAWVLTTINAQQVHLDSFAVILSVFAQILMTLRYADQWTLWIIVNVLTISLWFTTLIQSGGGDWAVFAMWVAFLINSVYGWWNWRNLAKQAPTATEEVLQTNG